MFIDGDFFEGLADISFGDPYNGVRNINNNTIKEQIKNIDRTPILYISTDRLKNLLNQVRDLRRNVIIIAHNSDATYGDEIINLIPQNVVRVWCQNYNGTPNEKIKPLPIGLERKRWFPEQKKQDVIKDNIPENTERENKVYMNFIKTTNRLRFEWFDTLNGKDFVVTEMLGHKGSYPPYINNIKKYKYIISPPGNGLDCHRHWESLYLGCIPIIQRSNFTNDMYSDMPVLLINNVNEVTEELLSNYIKEGNLDKTKCEYWENKIKSDVEYNR